MSHKRMIAMILMAIAILVCSSMIASAKDQTMNMKSRTITLSHPTLINGTLVPAGDYRLTHQMQGTEHIMIFKQVNGAAEAKAKCDLVPLTKKAPTEELRFKENAQNQRVLLEMTFRGDTVSHVLEP